MTALSSCRTSRYRWARCGWLPIMDIVVKNMYRCIVIDIALPNDGNIRKK